MAERIVAYKIKVVQDGSNGNTLNQFAKRVLDTERKIARERELIGARANENIASNQMRMNSLMLKDSKATYERMGKDAESAVKRTADAAVNAAKRVEGALAGSATRLSATVRKAAGSAQVELGKSSAAAIAEVEKSAKATADSSRKSSEDASESTKQAAEKARKEFDRLDSKLDGLEGKMRDSGRELRGRFEEWAGGVMQFGRGLAAIGIAGEEDLEKVARGLIRIQGAFDTVIGGVKTFQELRRVVEAYRAAQVTASAIQTATAQRNVAAIQAETVATNGLAAARGRAAVSGQAAQNAPASGKGGFADLVSRGGQSAGRRGAITGAVTTGGTAIGARFMGGAGALAGKVGATGVGAGIAGTAAAGLAAVGGAAFALVSSFKTAEAALESGVGGGAQEGSFVDTVGGSNYNPFSWVIAFDVKLEAMAKASATERMKLELEANKILNQRNRDLAALQSNQLTQQLDNRLSDNLIFGDETADQRLAITRQNITGLQASAGGIIESASASSEAEGLAARRDLILREVELQKEALQLQREIGQEKVNAARESLEASKQELEITRQSLQADQDRLLSAKERFGQLDEIEQQRLIGIKTRADSGEELTREERALLRGVGTEEATGFARQGDLAAADAAGFDSVFGQVERDRIQANQQLQSQLEAQVQVQQDVIVKIEQDTDAVVGQVKDQLQALQNELYPVVERIIQEEVLAAKEEIRKQFEARQSQLPRGGGRR